MWSIHNTIDTPISKRYLHHESVRKGHKNDRHSYKQKVFASRVYDRGRAFARDRGRAFARERGCVPLHVKEGVPFTCKGTPSFACSVRRYALCHVQRGRAFARERGRAFARERGRAFARERGRTFSHEGKIYLQLVGRVCFLIFRQANTLPSCPICQLFRVYW